jgi:hypothetical protein
MTDHAQRQMLFHGTLVLFGGMLTGLPIVSSDLPVLAEKLDTGGGFVCAERRSFNS